MRTAEQLLEIIRAGEPLAVDFKGKEREPFEDPDLVEAGVCLTNRRAGERGWLLVR